MAQVKDTRPATRSPFGKSLTFFVTMATPTVAVLIMLFWVSPEVGWGGIPGLLGLNRAGLKGWPLAIGVPAAIHLAGVIVLSLSRNGTGVG